MLTLSHSSSLISLKLVILPIHSGAWETLSRESVKVYLKTLDESKYCNINAEQCISIFQFSWTVPFVLGCLLFLVIVIVSFIVDRGNRRSFVNKKIIMALTEQRERSLQQQKEEQENLLYTIFPKVIAKDLIKQTQGVGGKKNLDVTKALSSVEAIGRTVARIHPNVTILFTDIVGFTSMSQSCLPYEVMHFLHSLFTAFDDLIDMDSHLWKVETIGDAFMVASGLQMGSGDASEDEEEGEALTVELISPHSTTGSTLIEGDSTQQHAENNGEVARSVSFTFPTGDIEDGLSSSTNTSASEGIATSSHSYSSQTTSVGYKRSLSRAGTFVIQRTENSRPSTEDIGGYSAHAAIAFGKAALDECYGHAMPNGAPTKIRVGVHSGLVCSGVVGRRMPRFCLYGDTVNTASRMESTCTAGRLQISEDTYALVKNQGDFEWEARRGVNIKGKGNLKTFLLVEEPSGGRNNSIES